MMKIAPTSEGFVMRYLIVLDHADQKYTIAGIGRNPSCPRACSDSCVTAWYHQVLGSPDLTIFPPLHAVKEYL